MGPVAAARRKLEIERDLGHFDKHSSAQVVAMQEERAALIKQHPDIEDVTSQDVLRDYSTSLSKTGRRGAKTDLEKRRDRTPAPARQRAASSRPRATAARRRASSSSPELGRGVARSIRRGIRDTGVPAGARSATRTALNFAGAGFGLSIMYLLLTNAGRAKPGQAAVELFAKGIGRTAQVLVSPAVDPLSPGKTATKPLDLSKVGPAVAAPALAVSTITGAPIVPGVTPLLADPGVVAADVLSQVHLPHLAKPYVRPPAHVRQLPHAIAVH